MLPIVLFSPDSLDIVKGAPAKRREFINMIASQLSKNYLIALQEYNKCLKIKIDPENDILKRNIIVPLDSEITEADFKIIK